MHKQTVTWFLALLLVLLLAAGCGAAANGATAVNGEQVANELLNAKPEGTPAADAGAADETASRDDDKPAADAPASGAAGEGADVIVSEAKLQDLQILILESFPVQVNLQVTGMLPDGCTTVGPIDVQQNGDRFEVTVNTVRPRDMMCTQVVSEFQDSISLPVRGLAAGTYTVLANGLTDSFTLDVDNVAPGEAETGPALSEADLIEIIRLTMEHAILQQAIPDYAMLFDQDVVVMSTKNLPADLTDMSGFGLTLLTPEEIQERANDVGDFLYLEFSRIESVAEGQVKVSLNNTWARAETSDMVYLSGGGLLIEFVKGPNGWQGTVTEAWIS